MRLAIFLNNLDFEGIASKIIKILMFDVDNKVIMSIGEETVSLDNKGYLMMLMFANNIITVYADNLSESLKEMLQKADIEYKSLKDLKNNPIFRPFLIG